LSSLEENYFQKSCALSASCHSGGQPAGGLDLSIGNSYDALVNVPGVFAPQKMLVVPGDPDNSFLVQKVEAPEPGEGTLMPLGATEPMDPDCRIKALRDWIAAGAENN